MVVGQSGFGALEKDGEHEVEIATGEGDPGPIKYERFVWHPATALAQQLPPGFELAMARCPGPNNIHRWFPEEVLCRIETLHGFVALSFLGGLEILRKCKTLSDQQVFSYRIMFLLYSRRRVFREHYGRHFNWSRDFFIRPSGRADPVASAGASPSPTAQAEVRQDQRGSRTVLSAIAPGMTVGEFSRLCEQKAQAQGLGSAEPAKLRGLGLHELAKQNPLELAAEEIPRVVYQSLFDLTLTSQEVEQVPAHDFFPRLLTAIEEKKDVSDDEFEKWFRELVSHKFRNLAQQKKPKGGPLSPDEAKQVVLALIWRAHRYVGDCLHCQMAVIRDTAQSLMTADERTLFERLYFRQDVFAELPWLLVRERTDFIAAELFPWLDDPNRQIDAAVIHRLMQMYPALTQARRSADRTSKQNMAKAQSGKHEFEYDDARDQPAAADRDARRSRDSVREILKQLKLTCPHCDHENLSFAPDAKVVNADNTITVDLCCEACYEPSKHSLSQPDWRAAAEAVID